MKLLVSLAGIEEKYLEIYRKIAEDGDEIDDEMLEILNINNNDFEEKLKTFNCIIENAQNEIDVINRYIESYEKKKKQRENFINFLKESISKTVKKIATPSKTKGGLPTYKVEFKDISVNLIPSQSVEIFFPEDIEKLELGKYKVYLNVDNKKTVDFIKSKFPDAKGVFEPSKTLIGEKIEAGEIDKDVADFKINHRLKIKI
jgi:hypothetical protein